MSRNAMRKRERWAILDTGNSVNKSEETGNFRMCLDGQRKIQTKFRVCGRNVR